MINSTTVNPLNHPQLEFLLVDAQSLQILRSNLAVRDNLGLTGEALHQLKLGDIHSEFSQPELMAKVTALPTQASGPGAPSQASFRSQHRRADGSEYPVQTFIYASRWHNDPVVALLCIDLSAQGEPAAGHKINEPLPPVTPTRSALGGWQFSLATQTFTWTAGVFAIHGMAKPENQTITLKEALQWFLPESQHRLRRRLDPSSTNTESWTEVLTLSTPALHKKWVRVTGHPALQDGELVGLFGSIEDITGQNSIQNSIQNSAFADHPDRQLGEQSGDFEQIVDAAPYGILQLDPQLRLLSVNASGAVLYRQPAAGLIGKNYLQLLDPAARADTQTVLDQAISGADSSFEVHTDSGDLHTVSAYPLQRDNHQTTRLILVCQDITQRRSAEIAIAASESRYRFMIDSSPDMVIVHDLNGTIVDANPAACELLGYTRPQLLEKNFTELDSDWFSRHFSGHQQPTADQRFTDESTLQLAGGDQLPCEYHTHVTTLDGQTRVLNFIRDISARAERERHAQALAARVQHSQKRESLGVLAGGIAHDFNNLLTSMLGNANLARSKQAKNEPVESYLQNIESAAIRAGELCTQMLTYAGQGHFTLEKTDLNKLIGDMTRLLELAASNRAVINYRLGNDLPLAMIDSSQIRQALMSLVINAAESVDQTSGMVTVSSGVMRADSSYLGESYLTAELPAGDYLFIEVSDNGTGMDQAVQQRIFDPFFSTKFTGRGLGLAAVLGIVRSHQGGLKVYSETGRGSTFKILLPTSADQKPDISGAAAAAPTLLKGSILLADDEETVATVTAQMIEALGLQATITSNGRECVTLYQQDPNQFDLVLLDMSMPELDGAETFRELKTINPKVKVILTSGFGEEDAAHRFSGKGLAGFLQKPYHLSQLRELVGKLLS